VSWTWVMTLGLIKYILSVWASFKLKQAATFCYVSKFILHGSKTKEQVANQWYTLWKKFKACIHHEKHTGRGNGDELKQDANNPEPKSQDSDIEVLDDESKKEDTNKEVAKKKKEKINGFTELQLITFEQTDAYKLILEVVRSNPKVVKAEEFDSAQSSSDSEDTSGSLKSSSTKSSASRMTDMIEKTFEIIMASMAGISESWKAAAELAACQEEHEIKAAEEEWEHQDQCHDLEERQLHIDEDNHCEAQWEKGEHMAAWLEWEELEEAERVEKAKAKNRASHAATN
ncbi:hypothetical protein FRC11_001449, partial [Ceratobasidium sp. 423]